MPEKSRINFNNILRPADMLFPDRIEKMKSHICVTCGAKVNGFKNSISQKEYLISGMCQECQDGVFG